MFIKLINILYYTCLDMAAFCSPGSPCDVEVGWELFSRATKSIGVSTGAISRQKKSFTGNSPKAIPHSRMRRKYICVCICSSRIAEYTPARYSAGASGNFNNTSAISSAASSS